MWAMLSYSVLYSQTYTCIIYIIIDIVGHDFFRIFFFSCYVADDTIGVWYRIKRVPNIIDIWETLVKYIILLYNTSDYLSVIFSNYSSGHTSSDTTISRYTAVWFRTGIGTFASKYQMTIFDVPIGFRQHKGLYFMLTICD